MKRVSPLLVLMLACADLAGLWAAFHATAAFRLALNQLLPAPFTRELVRALFPPAPLVALCWGATLVWTGAYDLLGKRSLTQVAAATAKAVTLAMCLQVVLLFFFTREVYARSLILIFWAASLVFLTTSRELAFYGLRRLKAVGVGADPVAVVGTGAMAQLLASKIAADREPRFRFAGYLADDETTTRDFDHLEPHILGHVEKAEEVINEHGLKRLFVTTAGFEARDPMSLVLLADRMQVGIERVPDVLGLMALRVHVTELDGVPLLTFQKIRFTRWDEALKRTVDILVSGLGLLLLAPAGAVIAAAIKLTSPGPVLFRQRRVGRGGKHFRLLKFRSMTDDAEARRAALTVHNEASGHLFKIKRDPRITRVGAMLRRWSLDELPQLWNVLVGEMSLVGPRPLPHQDVSGADSPYPEWCARRSAVRPGITGLWQVSGRSQLEFKEMVRLDLYYINNWSLGLDLKLLARTIPAVLSGHGAY